jgi:hypothetical protein
MKLYFDLSEEEIAEASSAGKPKPSGLYDVKIDFIARYDSPGSDSKGFYISGELEDGFKYDQYINFQKKDGTANKFGQLDINSLFVALELSDTAKPEGPYQLKMWGSEREGYPIKEASGKVVKMMLRDTEEIGDDGVLRNKLISEGFVCKDGFTGVEKIKGITEAKEVSKWLERIAKTPTKKAKAKPATQAAKQPGNVDTAPIQGWGN